MRRKWKKVWSELYATIIGINELRECFYGKCLGQTRHTFKQNMTIAQERDEQRLYKMFLSNDNLVHTSHQVGDKATLLFYSSIKLSNINRF